MAATSHGEISIPILNEDDSFMVGASLCGLSSVAGGGVDFEE